MSEYNEEEVKLMLDDCTAEKRLRYSNQWERDFLSRCFDMFDKSVPLSTAQLGVLDKIWYKVTANG